MSSTLTEFLAPSEWLALGAMGAACLSALYSRWSAKAAIRSNQLSTLNALRSARASARYAALKFSRQCGNAIFFCETGDPVDPTEFVFKINAFRDEIDVLGPIEHLAAEELLERLSESGMKVWRLLSELSLANSTPAESVEKQKAKAALSDIWQQMKSARDEINKVFASAPEAA